MLAIEQKKIRQYLKHCRILKNMIFVQLDGVVCVSACAVSLSFISGF